MSFESFEESRYSGQPVTLYLFRYGSAANSFYAYTDAEQNFIYNGVEYEAIPIVRGAITASGSLDKSTLSVEMPKTARLAELFRIYPPSQVVTLVISQGHLNDGDVEFLAIWSGRVLSCAREDNQAKFACEPVSTSMRRPGLRRNYQYGCPHVLYGDLCRASMEAATYEASVTAISGTVITLASGWLADDLKPKLIGGMVRWTKPSGDTELRTVMRRDGNNITLAGLPFSLTAGADVELILGCNHKMDDCQNVHTNIHNFGGQPWIPTKNPIGTTNNFY